MGMRNCGELGLNLQRIITRLLANQNLCKLLYYADSDPLSQPDITDTRTLYEKYIYITPKYNPVEDDRSAIVLIVKSGERSSTNDEFINLELQCFVYVPVTNWIIKDTNLRPFAIIGEIQNSLQGKNINGLGTIQVNDFSLNLVTDQSTCYCVDIDITLFT